MRDIDDCIPARAFLGRASSDLMKIVLADRDRLLEEIYELHRFKALAVDLIECQSGGREGGR